jgi:hypothetical protein
MKKFEEFNNTFNEELNGDEKPMVKVQMESMIENINHILACLSNLDDDLPAWVQDKISVSNHSMEAISDWCNNSNYE